MHKKRNKYYDKLIIFIEIMLKKYILCQIEKHISSQMHKYSHNAWHYMHQASEKVLILVFFDFISNIFLTSLNKKYKKQHD